VQARMIIGCRKRSVCCCAGLNDWSNRRLPKTPTTNRRLDGEEIGACSGRLRGARNGLCSTFNDLAKLYRD